MMEHVEDVPGGSGWSWHPLNIMDACCNLVQLTTASSHPLYRFNRKLLKKVLDSSPKETSLGFFRGPIVLPLHH